MGKINFLFFLGFFLCATSFAVVDMVKLLDSYDKAKSREALIESKRKDYEKKLLDYKNRLDGMEKELVRVHKESQSIVLNEKARKERSEQAKKLYQEIQLLQKEAISYQRNGEIKIKRNIQILQNQTIEELRVFIRRKARELGYDFVFLKKNLAFYNPEFDITSKVLPIINE